MMTTSLALTMAFRKILREREPHHTQINRIFPDELDAVLYFLTENCATFPCSPDEIATLFRSYHDKRYKKKIRSSCVAQSPLL